MKFVLKNYLQLINSLKGDRCRPRRLRRDVRACVHRCARFKGRSS